MWWMGKVFPFANLGSAEANANNPVRQLEKRRTHFHQSILDLLVGYLTNETAQYETNSK